MPATAPIRADSTPPGSRVRHVGEVLKPPCLLVLDEHDHVIAHALEGRPTAAGGGPLHVSALLPEPCLDAARATLDLARATLEPQQLELDDQGMHLLVRCVPVSLAGRGTALVVSWVDVRSAEQTERALRASEARGRAFLEALPDMFFRLSRDGVCLDLHAGRAGDLAAPRERVVGHNLTNVLPPDVSHQVMQAIDRAQQTGQVEVFDYHLPLSPGASHFEARVVPSGDDEIVAIVRNVTERRALEAQLQVADRLATLGAVSAGLAHEVNNPLAYVMLNLSRVARTLDAVRSGAHKPTDVDAAVEAVERSLEGVERVRLIVRDLGVISRCDEQRRSIVDVTSVLEASVRVAAATAAAGVTYETELDSLPPVLGDEGQLGQLFLNLLVNAGQASARVPGGEARVVVRAHGTFDWLVVDIDDTGPGVASEHASRLFEPFFTTKPRGEGTGLGLWISRRVAESLGGTVTFASRAGGGTTFTVRLPAAS